MNVAIKKKFSIK